jgi:hypothetical protein
MDALFEKLRLCSLLDHFADIPDPREPWRVAHPLPEVMLPVVCGTMAGCDDFDAIAEWSRAHLASLRRTLPYHHGIPKSRWLNILMNRISASLFSAALCPSYALIAWIRRHGQTVKKPPTGGHWATAGGKLHWLPQLSVHLRIMRMGVAHRRVIATSRHLDTRR